MKQLTLFCDYFTSGSPGLLLGPVKREVLSLQPYVVLYHDFITDAEAEDIKMLAQPGVSASSEHFSHHLRRKTPRLLDQRISLLTGLNVTHPYGEYLQVVNYGIGGHYEPHFDHATVRLSILLILFSVEAGGSTAFIYANFSVPVVEKAAIFWWNLHRNGQGDMDTLHAGCPVLIGDKWVANKWIHEYGQEFQHRCSLNPEE
uniref:Prolyl 4-hydroxylase, alpha polypeptide III n=1 Tax=Sphaeramia orbicularis TaxID=375764 RepID=A0A672YF43_9TELE